MRLWHQSLIPYLPRQQLLGQHRECCALRGKGWGKKHATVDYMFTHEPEMLAAYHRLIMAEMRCRKYSPDKSWDNCNYRGAVLGIVKDWCDLETVAGYVMNSILTKETIYPEHNADYLKECIENLRNKGINVTEMEKLL
jgi:uncharacterized protein (TIGR02328 family)